MFWRSLFISKHYVKVIHIHIKTFYPSKSKLSVKMLRHDDVIICHLILTGYQKQSLNQQASLAQWHQHKAIIHQIEYKDLF